MFKLKNIIILAIVILTFGIAWKYYKKIKEAEKLKIGSTSLSTTKKLKSFSDLVDIFKNGLQLKGYVSIRNFSNSDYTLNQIKVDCYTPKTNKLLAEQTNIIQNNIVLKAKQETNIPLEFTVNVLKALSLFKECSVIPEDWTVWKIIAQPMQAYEIIKMNNLKMKLKGFIQAEGITLSINENYNLYE